MQQQLIVDIIKAIIITAIIPISSYFITKFFDYKITKKLERLQNDVSDIKKELQINTDIKEYINKIEAVANYCVEKIENKKIKFVIIEKNRMFIYTITDILTNNWLDIKYFELIQNKFNSGFMYCENYLRQNLSKNFCDKFIEEHKINFNVFLKELEAIIFSSTNQKILKIVDLSISFIRRYNELARLLQGIENEKL